MFKVANKLLTLSFLLAFTQEFFKPKILVEVIQVVGTELQFLSMLCFRLLGTFSQSALTFFVGQLKHFVILK